MRHFYHCAVGLPQWRVVAACHADGLAAGSLAIPTTVGLVGDAEARREARAWFQRNLPCVDSFVERDAGWEHSTLSAVRSWAAVNDPGAVLYMHAKGSYHVTELNQAWRECMTEVLVGRWRECLEIIRRGGDVVGSHWFGLDATDAPFPHFAGNFWWASSAYVAGLPEPGPVHDRYSAEAWIGMNDPFFRDLSPGHPWHGHCTSRISFTRRTQ